MDTATPCSTAAIVGHHGDPVESSMMTSPGEGAVAQIDALMRGAGVARSELTHVAVGVGPGPYTSTRIGVTIAVTIGHALNIPVAGICTLDAMAIPLVMSAEARQRVDSETQDCVFGVVTDARRREVYWAIYDCAGNRVGGPAVGKPADLLARYPGVIWAGAGLDRYPHLVTAHRAIVVPPRFPSARAVGELAKRTIESGEQISRTAAGLTDHSADGSGSVGLQQRLLAPYPLYLRRPDTKLLPESAVSNG